MKKIEVGTSIQADRRRCNQAAQPATTCQDGKEGEKMRVRGAFSPTSTPSNRMMLLLAVEELNSFELRT